MDYSNYNIVFQLPSWMDPLETSLDYWYHITTSKCKVRKQNPRESKLIILLPVSWQTSNVDILDFSFASGGACKSFLGCVHYQNSTSTITSTSASVSTSTSVSPSSPASSTASSQSGKFDSILHYLEYFKSYFNFLILYNIYIVILGICHLQHHRRSAPTQIQSRRQQV